MENSKNLNTALLIQGPYINDVTEEMIFKNRGTFKEIVFSTWNSSAKINLEDVKIIQNPLPKINDFHNSQNIYFQVCSTIYGLENIKSRFVIKARSDEYFSNLKLFVEKNSNTKKLILSNIFLKDVSYAKFHISDHLFLGETKLLLKSFKLLKTYLELREDNPTYNIKTDKVPAEVKIALFYLNAKGYSIKELLDSSEPEAYEIMNSEFEVFDIEVLKPYLISSSAIGKIKCLKKYCLFDGASGLNYCNNIKDLAPKNKFKKKIKVLEFGIKRRIFNKAFLKFFKIVI